MSHANRCKKKCADPTTAFCGWKITLWTIAVKSNTHLQTLHDDQTPGPDWWLSDNQVLTNSSQLAGTHVDKKFVNWKTKWRNLISGNVWGLCVILVLSAASFCDLLIKPPGCGRRRQQRDDNRLSFNCCNKAKRVNSSNSSTACGKKKDKKIHSVGWSRSSCATGSIEVRLEAAWLSACRLGHTHKA